MNSPLIILSPNGEKLYETPINTGCKRRISLMNEDCINIKFSDRKKIEFPVGCHIGDFYITQKQDCKLNTNTGAYDYDLIFNAHYYRWANKLLKYIVPGVANDAYETSFKLTATIDIHGAVILRALANLGYTYNNSPFRIDTSDTNLSSEAKYINYNNLSILDAIAAIAEAWECEWWITGNAICFGKCSDPDSFVFKIDDNVESISSNTKENTANRIYVFGSDRNLPPNYRTTDSNDTISGIVNKRLLLPKGTPYLQIAPNIPEDEIIEEVVVLDSIYPKTSLTITEVEIYTDTRTGEDGVENTQSFYRIKYGDSFPFSQNYILENEELHMIFESGLLNGMEFAVTFNPLGLNEKNEDGSWNEEAQILEIVVNEDYGRLLPDDVLCPKVGDTFALSGWDATKMEDLGLIEVAENKLLSEGQQILEEYKKDTSTYTCVMMFDWCKEQIEKVRTPSMGSSVLLHFNKDDEGRPSRIIGIEYDLDIEYSNVVYTCGEKVSSSRLKNLENKVEGLIQKGNNVRIQNGLDFLSKRYSDSTPFSLSVGGQLTDTKFQQGLVGGRGWGAFKDENGDSVIETDYINVRKEMFVNSLTVNQIKAVGGMNIYSIADIRISRVEEPEDEPEIYRCYFDLHEDYIANLFRVDDIAYSHRFTPENNSLRYYKRRVMGIGEDYIDLSKEEFVDGHGIPEEGDVVVQYGNYTDKNRQFVGILDVQGGGYLRFLCGLDSVNAAGREYSFQGYQSSTGERWFIGDKETGQYAEYVNRKLTIFGTLSINSSIVNEEGDETSLETYLRNLGNRTFTEQPIPPYKEGDIWVNVTYKDDTHEYEGEILYCKTTKDFDEEFDIEDWAPAEDYVHQFDFLKDSLKDARKESTLIDGGLILTSQIRLGQTESEVWKCYSGISGLMYPDKPEEGYGIAAWYGGDPIDGELAKWANKETTRYAQSLFRHDGTGYLAGGNIGWNLDGSGWLAGHNIEWDKDGLMSFGSGIKIGGTTLGGLETSISSIQTFIAALSRILVPVNEGGDVLLAEDNETVNWNHRDLYAARIKGYGFYADGFVSTYGLNKDTGNNGGSSTLAGLNDVKLSNPISNGQALVYRNGYWINETVTSGNGGLNEGQLAEYLSSHIYTATFVEGKFSAKTYNPVQGAATINIPTNTSHLTNDSDFITSAILDNYVKKTGDTMTGTLQFSTNKPLQFNQAYPYIINPNGGFFFVAGTDNIPNTNVCILRMVPGTPNIIDSPVTTDLGRSTVRWNNIYSVLGNFSTSITIGGATLSWDATERALKINTGLYSEQWISVRGINNEASSGVGISEEFLANYLTSKGYATQQWVKQQLSDLQLTGYLSLSGGAMKNTNLVTNMNADLLDGVHESGFMRSLGNISTTLNDNIYRSSGYALTGELVSTNGPYLGFGISTYYKVLSGHYNQNRLLLRSYNNGTWTDWREFAFTDSNVASASYATSAGNADTLSGLQENSFMRSLGNISTTLNENIYRSCGYALSGEIVTTNGPFIGFGNATYFKVLYGNYNQNRLFLRSYNNGTWLDAREFAFLDSNVASATQLQTSRDIWGQSFNGTSDITGALSNVTDINMSGTITSSSTRPLKLSSTYPYLWNTAGGFFFIAGKESYSNTNDCILRIIPGTTNIIDSPITTELGRSTVRWANIYSVLGNFSGAVTMTSTLTVSGLITAQSGIKIGDGTITWDYSAGGFKFSHGLYSEQWVSARGLNHVTGNGGDIDLSGYLKESRWIAGINIDTYSTLEPFIAELPNPTGTLPNGTQSWYQIFNWGSAGDANHGYQMANNYATDGSLYFRSRIGGRWNNWKTILDSSNWQDFITMGGSQTLYSLTFSSGTFSAKTYTPDSAAQSINIPTHTSHLTNDSGFITLSSLSGYLPLSGGTMTGSISTSVDSGNFINAFRGNAIFNSMAGAGAFVMLSKTNSTNGVFLQGAFSNSYAIWYSTNVRITSGTNSALYTTVLMNEDGNMSIGTLSPPTGYKLYVSGTIGATGAVSQNVSDLRLKTDIESVNCLDILCKVGNVFSYRYNSEAVADRPWLDTTTLHYGLAYQNAVRANIPGFTGTDEHGFGWLNFLSSDMLALLTGGVLELAIRQRQIENDINYLKQKVSELEERVRELEN